MLTEKIMLQREIAKEESRIISLELALDTLRADITRGRTRLTKLKKQNYKL